MEGTEADRDRLVELLRDHSLILGEVTLASGATASYYVDARRTVMRPEGFLTCGRLIAERARALGADAVGGPVTAAIPLACAAIAVPEGSSLRGFFVRSARKEHGLQRWIEGATEPGDRVLVVEDTVTTGGSTVEAIAGAADAPFEALATVDEIYPDRPDRSPG